MVDEEASAQFRLMRLWNIDAYRQIALQLILMMRMPPSQRGAGGSQYTVMMRAWPMQLAWRPQAWPSPNIQWYTVPATRSSCTALKKQNVDDIAGARSPGSTTAETLGQPNRI